MINEKFESFDKNKNGMISSLDLKWGMKDFGINPTEIELSDVLNLAGFKNNKNAVSKDEFLQIILHCFYVHKFCIDENDLKVSFRQFENDKGVFDFLDFEDTLRTVVSDDDSGNVEQFLREMKNISHKNDANAGEMSKAYILKSKSGKRCRSLTKPPNVSVIQEFTK